MKILYIDVNCKGSSTGQIVYSLFSECKKNNIEATVCYGRGPRIKEDGIFKFGFDIETMFHALLTRITGYTGCFSFFSTKRLLMYIKRYKPDIVHIHELHAYFVNIKQLLTYLKKHNIKTIFTNHCEFLYTGKCGHSGDCIKYQTECNSCPKLKEYPKSLFFDQTKKMYKAKKKLFEQWKYCYYVSPSIWLKCRMESSFLKDKNIRIINNGIDTSFYGLIKSEAKGNLKIPFNNKIVLTAAPNVFSDLKGGHRFLVLAKKMSVSNITFVIVGSNKDDVYESVTNVIVLPFLNEKQKLLEMLCISDCFVICSKNEVFPTTSIEAQCCGSKVVGFDVGGVKETILENNGYVVPYNDIDDMAAKITTVLNQNYDKKEVSEKAKLYYSRERMFVDYYKLYSEICD